MKTVFDGLVSRLDMVTKDSSLRISQQQLSKLKSKEKKTGKKYPRTVVQMHSKNSRRRRGERNRRNVRNDNDKNLPKLISDTRKQIQEG